MEPRFKFGRYKGLTFKQVRKINACYLVYLYDNVNGLEPEITPEIEKNIKQLREECTGENPDLDGALLEMKKELKK